MNNENLKPFQNGIDARRNTGGRPPKLLSRLKAAGYKLSEINDCISTMLSMTCAQIKAAVADESATALEAMVGRSILRSIKEGKLDAFEILLSRRFGKPKETVEINSTPPEIEAAKSLYENLIEKGVTPKTAVRKVLTAARANGIELSREDVLDAEYIEN